MIANEVLWNLSGKRLLQRMLDLSVCLSLMAPTPIARNRERPER